MALICNRCAEEWKQPADFSIEHLVLRLRNGEEVKTEICEYCGIMAIRKDEQGKIEMFLHKKGWTCFNNPIL